MKKLIAFLLLMCLLPLCCGAEATDRTYEIRMSRADIAFTVPEGMICLTVDSSASEFGRWGMSQRDFNAYMEAYDVYAVMFDEETGVEYQLVVYPYLYEDYDALSGADALAELEAVRDELTQWGYEVHKAEWYRGESCAYAMLETRYTYEDGAVDNEVWYMTNRADYVVQFMAYAGNGLTEDLRADLKYLADSLTVTPARTYTPEADFPVKPSGGADGSAVFTMPGLQMSFMPLDARYFVTRESGDYAFSRLGFLRKKGIQYMEDNGISAMMLDESQRMEIYVYINGRPEIPDYREIGDVELYEQERRTLVENDWTVEELTFLNSENAKFSRAVISYVEVDGSTYRYITYTTCIAGCEIEIMACPEDATSQALAACEEVMDAFVLSIAFETAE